MNTRLRLAALSAGVISNGPRISKPRVLSVGVLVGLIGSLSAGPAASLSEEDSWALVNDLDRCVQRRFAETDKRLG